jgi:hypothetical protein
MLATGPPANDPTAVPYETIEEARMLLCVDEGELAEVRRAVGEAAYYLSDTLEPDERATLLGEAEAHLEPRQCQASEDRAADALLLLCDATAHPRLSADEANMRGAQLAVAALVAEFAAWRRHARCGVVCIDQTRRHMVARRGAEHPCPRGTLG